MYTLRIPSAEFATAALAASAKAGYLGAVLLLARRLDSKAQAELQEFWSDLNDLTGNELIVLVTGLETVGHRNGIRSYRLQREVFAEGVAMARSYKDEFEQHFDALLSVAAPTPETPHEDATTRRLIAPQGVTDIRQGLEISERELPALLIRSNETQQEVLICLANGNEIISPVLVISEIVKHLEDIPYKITTLQTRLREVQSEHSRLWNDNRDEINREHNFADSIHKAADKIKGRAAQREAFRSRIRRVLESAPEDIHEVGNVVVDYVTEHRGTAEQALEAADKIARYLDAPESNFLATLKKEIANCQKPKDTSYQSDKKLIALQARWQGELNKLKQRNVVARAQLAKLDGKKSEIVKALSKLIPLRKTVLCFAVEGALNKLGFEVVQNAGHVSNRKIYRSAAKSLTIRAKTNSGSEVFDLFLSHNSHDKPAVSGIAKELKSRGIKVWYDEWQLAPGQPWQPLLEAGLKRSKAIAVFVGGDGLGPWEDEEMQAALRIAVETKRSVIPILLPGAPSRPELPMFLANRTWVDLRSGLTEDAFNRIKWGVAGKKDANS